MAKKVFEKQIINTNRSQIKSGRINKIIYLCFLKNKEMNEKYTEKYDLHKVPDEILIAQLNQELGKANAYITELEFANKALKEQCRIFKVDRKEAMKDLVLKELKEQIANLNATVSRLRKENESYVIEKLRSNLK